jgi:signal transduction histidine kinase
LDNALKFSPQGSSIGLAIHNQDEAPDAGKQPEKNGGFVALDVSDRGPGVPDRYKRSIFDQFSQINGGKKGTGQGAGLGLAICRNIVDSHGGRIWVQDHSGGGTVFSVLLSRVRQSS